MLDERAASALRKTYLAFGTSAVLGTVKIVAGVLGRSYALIADGVESMLDLVGAAVVWSGLRIAAKPPDRNHPYGHGKADSLAGMTLALVLLAVAVALAVKSVHEIREPTGRPAPFTLAVLVVVVLVKEALFRSLRRTAVATGSTALAADAWHHRSDALTSIAAFVGISIAIVGGPAWAAADAWAALAACAVIAWSGVRLLRGAVGEAMDLAAPPEVETRVRAIAGRVDGVRQIEKCRIRKSGLGWQVDIHVVVDGEISVRRGHGIGHDVKDALVGANASIDDVVVHIEPHGRASVS